MGKIIIGVVFIVLGLSAFLGASVGKFLLALFLILIGLKFITGKDEKYFDFGAGQSSSSENYLNEVNIFSSLNKAVHGDNFRGGKVVVVFSGGKIDLRQSKMLEAAANMEVIAVFGGLELILPKEWKVNSQGTSIFGGYETKLEGEGSEKILNLKGVAILGEVKILN